MPLITSCRFEFHSVKVARTQTEGSFYQEPFWCRGSVHKDLFFFLSGCKACGPGANVHASKICIKLCFSHSGKDTEPALSSAWVTRHESNATHSLPLPPSPSLTQFWHDNTSIQLSGLIMFHACAPALTAVLSHFTPFDTSFCHQ